MKKTRSTTLRRAWPSSDFSDRASERTRSRSEKDYRLHKHYAKPFISHSVSHSPRIYMAAVPVSLNLTLTTDKAQIHVPMLPTSQTSALKLNSSVSVPAELLIKSSPFLPKKILENMGIK
ncbi:hypothetical protein MHYP_G00174910 [Metynnis hypsauchen]